MAASLAAHPHRPLENGNYPPASASSPASSLQPSAKNLLASSWGILEQPPPPSLREILGAYRARGDGDRDMLLAMLSAKSAEDQRIASVAALHRSMLEYYNVAPPPSPGRHAHHTLHHHHGSLSNERSYAQMPAEERTEAYYVSASRPHTRAYSSPDSPGADDRTAYRQAKRHRASASPSASHLSAASPAMSTSSVTPSSPRSDASRSPVSSRSTMAIDTLLHDVRSERNHRYAHAQHQAHLPSAVAAV